MTDTTIQRLARIVWRGKDKHGKRRRPSATQQFQNILINRYSELQREFHKIAQQPEGPERNVKLMDILAEQNRLRRPSKRLIEQLFKKQHKTEPYYPPSMALLYLLNHEKQLKREVPDNVIRFVA